MKGGYALSTGEGGCPIGEEERAAPIGDFGRAAQGGLEGCGSKEYADAGVVGVKVLGEFGQAVLDLGPIPVEKGDVVARGAMLADVADQAGLAVYADIPQEVGQEFAGGSDEGPAIVLFVLAGRLADDGDAVFDAVGYDGVLVGNESRGDHLVGGVFAPCGGGLRPA